MAPKLVIFDCDGVLVDTEGPANLRLAAWLTAAGYPVSSDECRSRFSGNTMSYVRDRVAEAGVDLGADFVERWNDGLPGLFANGVEEIPHIRRVVETVRGAGTPYCVASSARETKMRLTLGLTGLLPLFEHALFSATMVGRGKPFPDLFLHAAKTMGVDPSACVVVEDSVPGTVAGVAAGMRVYSYCGDPQSDRNGLLAAGGVLIDDMRELSELILA